MLVDVFNVTPDRLALYPTDVNEDPSPLPPAVPKWSRTFAGTNAAIVCFGGRDSVEDLFDSPSINLRLS